MINLIGIVKIFAVFGIISCSGKSRHSKNVRKSKINQIITFLVNQNYVLTDDELERISLDDYPLAQCNDLTTAVYYR